MKYAPFMLVSFAAPLGVLADCNHNNCLRAIIADAFPTRNGTADCSAYLQVTVTPPMSTFTATVTVPTEVFVSTTEIESSTTVATVTASTQTNVDLETSFVDLTSTTTVATVTVTGTVTQQPLERRQATASGSTFPAYASACTSFAKYSSACSCVGIFPDTVTTAAPSTTVTVTATSTSTSVEPTTTSTTSTDTAYVTQTTLITSTVIVSTTDATAKVSSTSTSTLLVIPTPADSIVKNGGFETCDMTDWWVDYPAPKPSAAPVFPGHNSACSLKTDNLINNKLFEMNQTIFGLPGAWYECSYDYMFTNYYDTAGDYVPYVHVYINDGLPGGYANSISIPSSRQGGPGLKTWDTTTFTFQSTGADVLYFDCASPQSPSKGSNYLYLDNIFCVPY